MGLLRLKNRETDKQNKVFEPHGYTVSFESFMADENFPEWGEQWIALTE